MALISYAMSVPCEVKLSQTREFSGKRISGPDNIPSGIVGTVTSILCNLFDQVH